MGLWGRGLVLFKDLDGLITLGRDHSQRAPVKLDAEDARFTRKGARLHRGLDLLEVMATCPVKHVYGAVVSPRCEHIVSIQCQGVDYCIVLGHCPEVVALWTLPNTDLVASS